MEQPFCEQWLPDRKQGEFLLIIKKKRILSETYLSAFQGNSNLSVIVPPEAITTEKLKLFGFSENDVVGTSILPNPYNSYAKKNAEQFFTINKALPKETYTQTLYWTRTQWAGRGETEEITEFIDIPRQRYHRDYHLPYSVEFTLNKHNDKYSIISEPIKNISDNTNKILNTINMALGLFGECELVSDKDPVTINRPTTIRLNWEVLPQGVYPWERVKETVSKVSGKYNNTGKKMMMRNCEMINSLSPDFIAYGKSGFKGYVVFGFTQKNLFILESMYPNNATYVFEKNWEELSKLSKAEILKEDLHKCRIIHNTKWEENFKQLFSDVVESE